jgi:hypothetical protein
MAMKTLNGGSAGLRSTRSLITAAWPCKSNESGSDSSRNSFAEKAFPESLRVPNVNPAPMAKPGRGSNLWIEIPSFGSFFL